MYRFGVFLDYIALPGVILGLVFCFIMSSGGGGPLAVAAIAILVGSLVLALVGWALKNAAVAKPPGK